MGKNYRFFLSFVWIILGLALTVCSMAGRLEDDWGSMGFALLIVGVLQVLRQIRYRTNEEYREKFDTESKDERNRFIANKAWAWSGYLFVLTGGVGAIVFKLMGREEWMMMASWNVCGIMVLYWVCWMALKRKY